MSQISVSYLHALITELQMKEMNARMGNGEKTPCISDVQDNRCMTIQIEPTDTNQAKKSPKVKIVTRDASLLAGTMRELRDSNLKNVNCCFSFLSF